MELNFQKLRATRGAALMRRGVYRWLVGPEGWPPVLRRPGAQEARPAPSGNVYVHLPFCETICPHCPYAKHRFAPDLAQAYRGALLQEIGAYLALPDLPPVHSLYFGGGTPSLTPGTVADVVAAFTPVLAPGAEVALEVHPRQATPGRLAQLRAAGVTRISLGIESLDARVLKSLGRGYDPEGARAAMSAGRAAGFEMLDINLIFGVPGLTRTSFAEGLRTVLEAGADQVSAYPLFTFGHTQAGAEGQEARYARTDDALRLAMQRDVSAICGAAGMVRSSVWSFTRAGMDPYTTVTRPDYVGLGAGAGSKAPGAMWFNTFSVPAYVAEPLRGPALVWKMQDRLAQVDWLYWRIYCGAVDGSGYSAVFGRSLEQDFGRFLSLLSQSGLARRTGRTWRLTETGAIWVHRMQALFSLSGIDQVWTACGAEPWPEEIRLYSR